MNPKTGRGGIPRSGRIHSARAGRSGNHPEFPMRPHRGTSRRGILSGSDEVVMISNGAEWIRNSMEVVFDGMETTCILDFLHVSEWLGDALKLPYPVKAKFGRMKERLEAGQVAEVVREPEEREHLHEEVANFLRYFRSNLWRMRYDGYRRRCLLTGSGVIDGGCRTLVADRLKRSGSR